MKTGDENNPILPPTAHLLIFAALGGVIGLAWGIAIDPNQDGTIYLPIISGLLTGAYLSWIYKDRQINVNLTARIGAGIALGSVLGVLPGMILGTILSIPFPDSFWPFCHLSGHVAGMFVVSVGIARGAVYLGDRGGLE